MQEPETIRPPVVPMNDEMITVAARIPLDHMRELKRLAIAHNLKNTSEMIRTAVAEYIHNHQGGNNDTA